MSTHSKCYSSSTIVLERCFRSIPMQILFSWHASNSLFTHFKFFLWFCIKSLRFLHMKWSVRIALNWLVSIEKFWGIHIDWNFKTPKCSTFYTKKGVLIEVILEKLFGIQTNHSWVQKSGHNGVVKLSNINVNKTIKIF